MEAYYMPRGFVNNFGAREVDKKSYERAAGIIKMFDLALVMAGDREKSSAMEFNENHDGFVPWQFAGISYTLARCYVYVGEASNKNPEQRESVKAIPLIRIHHDSEEKIRELEKVLGLD